MNVIEKTATLNAAATSATKGVATSVAARDETTVAERPVHVDGDLSYEVIIGCEIHCELKTATKAFCSCENRYGGMPNTRVCPVCLGLPGAMPIPGREYVELGAVAGYALGCGINAYTKFDRQHYFYPDLVKGYQITQYDIPLCTNGHVMINLAAADETPRLKRVRVERIHLEEDVGKSLHVEGAHSYIDFNRSGVPLIEIVSRPDMSSPEEAALFMQTVREILRYIGATDGNLEEGAMRCDANLNLRIKAEGREWRTPISEIKNMNSLRAVERALEYEIRRQTAVLAEGGTLERETRHWNDGEGVTTSMRSKEAANDYRYFPDPDIPPIVVTEELLESTRNSLPELPWAKERRFGEEYGLPEADAAFMAESLPVALYFEECVKSGASPLRAANWIRTEVFRVMNEKGFSMDSFPVKPSALAELVSMVDGGKLSTTVAREVFAHLADGRSLTDALAAAGASPGGLSAEDVEKMVEKVLTANGDVVEEIRSGRDPKGKKIKFLAGLVMRDARGQADAAAVSGILERRLKEGR